MDRKRLDLRKTDTPGKAAAGRKGLYFDNEGGLKQIDDLGVYESVGGSAYKLFTVSCSMLSSPGSPTLTTLYNDTNIPNIGDSEITELGGGVYEIDFVEDIFTGGDYIGVPIVSQKTNISTSSFVVVTVLIADSHTLNVIVLDINLVEPAADSLDTTIEIHCYPV